MTLPIPKFLIFWDRYKLNYDNLKEKKSWIETKSIEKAPDSNVKSDSQSIGPWLKVNEFG